MNRFIVLTFAFMFWGFYEMSGGADFEPGWYLDADAKRSDPTQVAEASGTAQDSANDVGNLEIVARADTGDMLGGLVRPASAATTEPDSADAAPIPASAAAAAAATAMPAVADIPLAARVTPERRPDDLVTDAVATAAAPAEEVRDIRAVAGSRVNMRTGPGTNYSVIAQLGHGERVEVLRSNGSGWLKLRVVDSQRIGWMADFLIAAAR